MTSGVSGLLERLRGGEDSALNEIVTLLYGELRRIATRHLRGERESHTLQSTALVHEAYIKLAGEARAGYVDRAHFLAVASRVMRQVLVDYARARAAKKRSGENAGGGPHWAARIEIGPRPGEEPVQLLDLDRVLDALSREDHTLAQVIEMRYFGGMTAEEMASVSGESVHVIRHDLRLAQAWLRRKLSS